MHRYCCLIEERHNDCADQRWKRSGGSVMVPELVVIAGFFGANVRRRREALVAVDVTAAVIRH